MASIEGLPKAWETLCGSILDMEDDELRAVEAIMCMMRQNIDVVRNRLPRTPVVLLGGCWGCLPAEVCSRIFEFGDPVNYDPTGPGSPSHSGYPIRLSLVSKYWRAVALSTPRIWSNIVIGYHATMRRAHSLPRGKLWLSRSERVPIQIFMGLLPSKTARANPTPLETAEQNVYLDAITTISTHLHHCFRLNICVRVMGDVENVLFHLRHPAPLLQQFGIHPRGEEYVNDTNEMVQVQTLVSGLFSNQSPLLASATLVYLQASWPQSILGHLTVAEVTFGDETWPLSTLLVLFDGSPMLTILVLSEFFLHHPDDDVDNHIVTNSSLQSLTINACPDDAATLLDKLELPVLEVLTLLSDDDVDGSPSSGGVISRSQFPAIKLFQLRCNFESGRLSDLLKRMDNLRTLICTRPDEIQVLSEVWYDANRSLRHIICPCLEELSVEYRRTVPAYSLESIDDFMRTRREVSGSLQRVTIPSFQQMGRGRRVEVQFWRYMVYIYDSW